jgi:hypothetical protein
LPIFSFTQTRVRIRQERSDHSARTRRKCVRCQNLRALQTTKSSTKKMSSQLVSIVDESPEVDGEAITEPVEEVKKPSRRSEGGGADAETEKVEARICRGPQDLGPGQIYFRPAICYQELIKGVHVCDGQLEFKLDFESGKNQARFGTGVVVEKGSARYNEIMDRQLSVVNDAEGRGDEASIRDRLMAAGSFGNAEEIAYLIRTCFVTRTLASQVLCEIAREGSVDVVQVLLKAGASPHYPNTKLDNKTALHFACESGYEEVASMLIRAMPTREDAYSKTKSGKTAFDLLREQDMNGVARRLEALVVEIWSNKDKSVSS